MSQLRNSLHTQVAYILAQRIMRGDLQPGDHIARAELLAEEFGVSRTVLREAIKLLTAKGLISSRPRIGMTVRPREDWSLLDPDVLMWRAEAGFDVDFLNDLIGLRRILEPGAAEFCARTATEDELDHLNDLFEQLQSSLPDPDAFAAADMQFHQAIVAACHNELLQQMSRTLGVTIFTICKITTRLPGSSELSIPSHEAVASAIARRDAEGAREAMQHLVDEAASEIARFLEEYAPEMDETLQVVAQEVGQFMHEHQNGTAAVAREDTQ